MLLYASSVFELNSTEILAVMDVLHSLTVKIEGKESASVKGLQLVRLSSYFETVSTFDQVDRYVLYVQCQFSVADCKSVALVHHNFSLAIH